MPMANDLQLQTSRRVLEGSPQGDLYFDLYGTVCISCTRGLQAAA